MSAPWGRAPARPPMRGHRKGGGRRAGFWLAALVALTAAAVLLLPEIKRAFPPPGSVEPQLKLRYRTLASLDEAALVSVTVSHLAGDSYTLAYRDGALALVTDAGAEPVSEARARELLDAVTLIAVEDTVAGDVAEVAENLADMGLEPPRATVTARFADGGESVIQLGAPVPETTYAYYRWSGDAGVHMCDAGVAEVLALTADRLRPLSQPEMEPSLAQRLTLERADGQRLALSFWTDAAGGAAGRLESPVVYPMSAESAGAALTALGSFRLGSALGEVNDANRADYGFDAPLLVVEADFRAGAYTAIDADGQLETREAEAAAYRFTLGRAEGAYHYTCLYEGRCYLVSKYLCRYLLDAEAQTLAASRPADMGGELVRAVTARAPGVTLAARASRVERVLGNNQLAVDENGDTIYDVSVTINGESAAPEAFDALTERLAALGLSGWLDAGWKPEGEPRWTLEIEAESGEKRVIEAYPIDAFKDALAVNGVALGYAHVEALDAALGEWAKRD